MMSGQQQVDALRMSYLWSDERMTELGHEEEQVDAWSDESAKCLKWLDGLIDHQKSSEQSEMQGLSWRVYSDGMKIAKKLHVKKGLEYLKFCSEVSATPETVFQSAEAKTKILDRMSDLQKREKAIYQREKWCYLRGIPCGYDERRVKYATAEYVFHVGIPASESQDFETRMLDRNDVNRELMRMGYKLCRYDERRAKYAAEAYDRVGTAQNYSKSREFKWRMLNLDVVNHELVNECDDDY